MHPVALAYDKVIAMLGKCNRVKNRHDHESRGDEAARPSFELSGSKLRGRSTSLVVSCLAVMLALAAGPAMAQPPAALDIVDAVEQVVSDAIARAEPSVVSIARVRPTEVAATPRAPFDPFGAQLLRDTPGPKDPSFVPNEYGTGVIVDAQGLILTAYHILGNSEQYDYFVTTIDRQTYKATLLAADPRSDLAILKIEASGLRPIKFGNADNLRKGQIVIALGNPYAIARDGQVSASWGIVANLHRKAPRDAAEGDGSVSSTLHQYGTLIQTDAKLNLGTSGGALIDKTGQMVGLTTSLAAIAGYEKAAGYAMPVDETFRRVVDTLKKGREVEYGFLGIEPDNLSEQEQRIVRQGMRVNRVYAGTPARDFGLMEGDIITSVDGEAVFDADSLVLAVGKEPVHATVTLGVVRNNDQIPPLNIRLAKFPVQGRKVFQPRDPWRGLLVDYKTATIQESRFRPIPPGDAVVVLEVDEDSPAWNAGVRRGMFITHVGNQKVSSPEEFEKLVKNETDLVRLRFAESFDGPNTVTIESGFQPDQRPGKTKP